HQRHQPQLQPRGRTFMDPKKKSEKPQIIVSNTNSATTAPLALTNLIDSCKDKPRIFLQHGGVYVRLRDGGRGGVETLTPDMMWAEFNETSDFLKEVKRGFEHIDPPTAIVKQVFNVEPIHNYPMPPELRRFVEVPFFDAEGNLVATPGYHQLSRAFLRLTDDLLNMPPV